MRSRIPFVFLAFWWSVAGIPLAAAPDFNRDIRPILAENCFHCHGPDREARKASLRLDTFEGAVHGGEFSDPIVPGDPAASEVVRRIFSPDSDEVMPPPESKRSLSDREKQMLEEWIASGAKYEEHWAWEAPERPAAPAVQNADLIANPIDAFLLRTLEAENLAFSEPASPGTILRRLSLDLIGLPPSPGDVADFETAWEADRHAALETAVDRLLKSPRFGERWARPWLDLARYADSNGFQADQLRPSWAYRDWVIDALNANMPYDQFTIEQLAGDLLPDASLSQKVATGFHRTVTCNVEAGVNPEANRVNQVVDRVNTTGTVWLGVTMECAQCHDHKYDPFTMKDYYSMFALFNNTPLEVQLPSNKQDVSHDFVGPYLDLPLSEEERKRAETLDRTIDSLRKEREKLLRSLPPEIARLLTKKKAQRKEEELEKLKTEHAKAHAAFRQIAEELAEVEKRRAAIKPPQTLVMVELEEPRETHIMKRGNFLSPGAPVDPDTPATLPPLASASDDLPSAPNRLDFASWLVRRDNPLTARVAVNRWWAALFGAGIVATLEDFGTQAEPPSHPDLLDWLAVEFMESGWDMKHILKQIVMSNAYQQSSRIGPELLERDPQNRLLARAPRFRLNAERLRDNALTISGLLSTKMHGKPVMPYQPPGLWRQAGRNEPKWIEQKDENRWRRGIYIVYRRAAPYPSMVNFDAPDRAACTVERARTNTPLQALTLLNDPAYAEMALALADRVLTEAGSPANRIDYAFRVVLARTPTTRERSRLEALLRDRLAHFTRNPEASRELLQNPKFVYQPRHDDETELAAWLYLGNVFLNLDETVSRN